jgi:hypothetical protein
MPEPRPEASVIVPTYREQPNLRTLISRVGTAMDADLSHLPGRIPETLAALESPPTDFVIGSRYVRGGQTQDWGLLRWRNSRVATLLCRPLVGPITDPMAGFFASSRDPFERADPLDPTGSKIGLELLCRCRYVSEVPTVFQDRMLGQSKLNLEQQARYLVHRGPLYRSYARRWGLLIRPIIRVMTLGLGIAKWPRRGGDSPAGRKSKELPTRSRAA